MVAGLVAMHIAAHETFLLDVLVVLIVLLVERFGKEIVKPFDEALLTTETLDHA